MVTLQNLKDNLWMKATKVPFSALPPFEHTKKKVKKKKIESHYFNIHIRLCSRTIVTEKELL